MTWQPSLAGGGIRLDPLTEADREPLFRIASDPLIWALHPAHDRWQEAVFRDFFEGALRCGGALVVRDAATGAMIGSSRFDEHRAGPDEVEIGWTFLARSHWGGATNAAMKRLMVGHALEHRARAIFVVGERNLRSRRAMEKVGGRLTDRTLLVEMAGEMVRHLVFAIDREGFRSGPLFSAGG
jgi:RimJ/RimL family protein N-acetyltransferase